VPRVVRQSARLPGIAAGHYTFVSSLSVYPDDIAPGATEATPRPWPVILRHRGDHRRELRPFEGRVRVRGAECLPRQGSYGAVVRQLTNWRAPDDPRGSARVP
jgi:hypothetical protein